MKPILMRHVEAVSESFKIWKNEHPYLHNPWHYHPECEITFITKGHGTLFIGDRILDYGDNELVLIGPNLPHEWRSNIKVHPDNHSQSLAVHFKPDCWGKDFGKIPEMSEVNKLLDNASRGILIKNKKAKEDIKEDLNKMNDAKGIVKMGILLSILGAIVNVKEIEFISSVGFVDSIQNDFNERINRIYEYVMKNFKSSISIEEVANNIFMTPTSFCHFFKKSTNKTFTQYVNEIRIGYA
ncbi:MAG TPA: AraC family transcriptional regulator, partial [Candidatus Babeliaceae bacterium]|nr:AraC family transcriptional regulator [Candidatus Babeliaceae bacterium]